MWARPEKRKAKTATFDGPVSFGHNKCVNVHREFMSTPVGLLESKTDVGSSDASPLEQMYVLGTRTAWT